MVDEQAIHELFPYRDANNKPSYRQGQFELIRDTLAAFEHDDVVDVVAEAPTGTGKTSVAVTVARVMTRGFQDLVAEAKYKAENEDITAAMEHMAPRQAHLITSMKMLQDVYLSDDPGIRLVKGKGNYECERNPQGGLGALDAAAHGRDKSFSCDDADIMFGRLCDRCPYRKAREDARWAPVALHNFDGFLHQITLGAAFTPRRLLTIDEAHNTEEKIRNFLTLTLSPRTFSALDLDYDRPSSDDIDVVTTWVGSMLSRVKNKSKEIADRLLSLRNGKIGAHAIEEMAKLVKLSRSVDSLSTKLTRFHSSRRPEADIKPATWTATLTGADTVVLEPVDAGRFVPSALMRYGEKRLHMSATFLNARGAYERSVNLRTGRARFLSVPSTFPVANRPIVKAPAGRLGARDWEENMPRAVERLREIMARHPDVRGVVHCTSYHMAEELGRALGSARVLVYDRATRASTVGAFVSGNTRPNAVLMAVSLTEGYDFKDDLCRFQVLVRVPYPVPGKCMKARMEKDPRFYAWRTSLTLVQTYGRGVRSATDHCQTYVLDDRFRDFVRRERDQLPRLLLEAIK